MVNKHNLIDDFESALVDLCNKYGLKGLIHSDVFKSMHLVSNIAFMHKMYEVEISGRLKKR